jgi:hypothetical protein
MSGVCATSPYDRTKYHAILHAIADKTGCPPPVLFTVDGKKVVMAFEHKNNSTSCLRKATKLARSIDHCNICEERVRKFFPLSIPDKDGCGIPLFLNPDTTPEPYKKLARRNEKYCAETAITGLCILTSDFLLDYPEEEGMDPRMEGRLFHHFHVRLPEKTDEGVEVDLLHKAFHRYCPELLPGMLDTLLPLSKWTLNNGLAEMIKDIKTSLECIRDAIPEITYGENIRPSVSWLWRVVERFEWMRKMPDQLTPHQRWLFCAEILLWTPISPDGLDHQNAVSCVIQQAHNNVIPVMSSANNRSALIKIMNHRLSPLNYQRRTAAPTVGQVQNALQGLGDFTNRIMTLTEAAKIPGAVVVGFHQQPVSSMEAFSSMIKEARATAATDPVQPKKSPWGLAAKCGPQIHGLRDLVKYARAHPESKMHLDASGTMESVYVAHTTLSAEKRCVPYLWAFHGDSKENSESKKKVFPFGGQWTEIAVIIPQYETLIQQNAIFLLRGGDHVPADTLNCCFPSFLNVAVRRVCGPAFEKLNKKIRLPVPTKEPAIGRGTSVRAGNKLIFPVRVLVEGKEIMLTTL